MRLTILGNSATWHVQQIVEAANKRGIQVDVRSFSSLAAQLDSQQHVTSLAGDGPSTDVVLVRSMPRGTLEQIIFRMDVLASHEQAGHRILNCPRSLEIAIDKYLGLIRLQRAGLPVPRTVVCQDLCHARRVVDEWGGDVVIKPLFGSEGRGIARIRNSLEADFELAKCQASTGLYYLQEYIPHSGFDIRLFVIGAEVYAMRRQNLDDWRLNVSLGARVSPWQVTDELHDLAIRGSRAVATEIAAVDVLPDDEGRLFVLEVNACPGWRALQSTTTMDIGDRICSYVEASALEAITPGDSRPTQ